MNSSIATHIGKIKRENQDLAAISHRQRFAVLADGMGGHAHGRQAAEAMCDTALELLPTNNSNPEQIIEAACQAIETTNTKLFESSTDGEISGTTVVMAIQVPGGIVSAHVGDSRLYRFRSGKLELLTKDHSRVQELIDQELITNEEAKDHPLRTHLTRSVGISESITIDLAFYDAQKGDTFLLASDGLKNDLSDDSIQEILSDSEFNIDQKAKRLIELAVEGKALDNITVAIIELEEIGNEDKDFIENFPITVVRPQKRTVDRGKTTGIFKSKKREIKNWKWYASIIGILAISLTLLLLAMYKL